MSDARDAILGRIRRALVDVPKLDDAAPPPRFRTASPAGRDLLIAEFEERARDYKVEVARAAPADAPLAIARILGTRGLVRLAMPADFPDGFAPEGFDLLRDEGLDRTQIAACDGVLTLCACAIAQTGTLVLDHGVGQGRRALTLLPDYHLCVVSADQVVGLVPEAVARMEPSVKAGRPLTFISGPSATSDIELNRVEGVHGPRTLDILLVG